MPVYEYKCQKCGEKVELYRGTSKIDDTVKCPKCGSDCKKIYSAFAISMAAPEPPPPPVRPGT